MGARIEVEKKRLIESMLLQGEKTYREIAEATNVSIYTVYRLMTDLDCNKSSQKEKNVPKKKNSNFHTRYQQGKYYISHY